MSSWYFQGDKERAGPVSLEELKKLRIDSRINGRTLVWNDELGGEWREYDSVDNLRIPITGPPPIPSNYVSDRWAWCIVAVPIVGGIAELIITETRGGNNGIGFGVLPLYFIPYVILSNLDHKVIIESGRERDTISGWWILIVPVFLWKRSRALGKSLLIFWAWILSFIFGLFITESGGSAGLYAGLGIPPCNGRLAIKEAESLFNQIASGQATAVFVDDIKTLQSSKQKRTCSAQIKANNTLDYNVVYTIEERGDEYYIQLNLR